MTDDVAESDEIDEGEEEGIPWCLQNLLFSSTKYSSSVFLLYSVYSSFCGCSCLKEGKAVFYEHYIFCETLSLTYLNTFYLLV